PAYGPQNDVTLKMPAFEWVHVQLHQQKGMISLSPPTICNSAQSRMNNGLVDASDFDDERNGWPVEQVWKEMHKLLPFSPDSVVTHGDFSLDNLIFDEGKLIGCIDVGRVGIADRYQDLAILWNCLGEFSPSLQKRLFQKYGIDNPDMNKLQFHLMLDEFF
ncbi:aminoglycoside 3'-phosphotransferase, partial [Escherichia coli]|uniref:aminoglycoside 3'-phosphotransferase n=1 Tax=Escherichia coli TaxID=562 RepID=UPI00207B561E